MIGKKIAIIRECRGFSQDYMAQKLGVKQPTYSSYEASDKLADDTLFKIAEILGVSVEDIKNPMPVFMSFHNSPNSYVTNSSFNTQETLDKILTLLEKQLDQNQTMNQKILDIMDAQIRLIGTK